MDKRCHQMLGYEVLSQKLNFQMWRACAPDDRHRVPLPRLQRQIALGEPFDLMETRLLTQQGHMAVDGNPRASCAGRHRNCRAGHRHPDRHHPRKAGKHTFGKHCSTMPPPALLISTPSASCAGQPRAVETFSGRTALQAKPSVLHRHEAQRSRNFYRYVDIVREQGSVEVEYLMRTATGALRWFSIRGTPWTAAARGRRDLDPGGHHRAARDRRALATAQAHFDGGDWHFLEGCWYKTR